MKTLVSKLRSLSHLLAPYSEMSLADENKYLIHYDSSDYSKMFQTAHGTKAVEGKWASFIDEEYILNYKDTCYLEPVHGWAINES